LRSFGAKADYFFGPGASDHLFSDKVQVKGHEVQSEEGQTLVAETIYGTLALSLEGGRRLAQRGAYVVRIGDFLPKGTVLAPGVEDADEQIRPGDEVIVAGERAFGVGRARMSGWEMVSASRGIAVDLRQVEGI
jgi:archaeosine synthase